VNRYEIGVVLSKEIKDLLKDRKTILLTILLPVLIYPILVFGMSGLAAKQEESLSQEEFAVAVTGDRLLGRRLLQQSGRRFNVVESLDPREDLEDGAIQAWLHVPPDLFDPHAIPAIFVISNDAEDRSRTAKRLIMEAIEDISEDYSRRRLQGLPPPVVENLAVRYTAENVASEERLSGAALGRWIPMLLIIMILSGAAFAAIDLVAGEKERGTLETLLLAPVERSSIVIGKFIVVLGTALISAAANMGSMYGTIKLGLADAAVAQGLPLDISLIDLLLILLLSVPVAILYSAILLIASAHAKSFKEGQYIIMPLTLGSIVPPLAGVLPNLKLASILVAVPVANLALAIKEVLSRTAGVGWLLLAFAFNALYAGIALYAATRIMMRETVLFRAGTSPGFRRRRGDWRREVFAFYAVIWLVLFYIGSELQQRSLVGGLLATEWILLLLPSLGLLLFYGLPVRRTLSIRRPHLRNLGATLSFWAAGFSLSGMISVWQFKLLPASEQISRVFEELFDFSAVSWPMRMFAFALTAGICEEILFRGVMAGLLRRYWPTATVSLVVGALFGLFHFSIYRIIPTGVLGVLLTYLFLRTGNLIYPMIMHTLQNGTALTLGPERLETIFASWWNIPVFLVTATVALRLMFSEKTHAT
jgi:sodium transport system permease protein